MYFLLLPLERGRKFRGQLMLAFLAMYGFYRFLIEFVREGATGSKTALMGMTQAQVASLILSFVAVAVYIALARRPISEPRAPSPPPDQR
jgi:prolipoprotein diacylglyceryltransferase